MMESLKKIWSEAYTIQWYDTDLNGQLKMSAIANYLQESAWKHANHLGFGYEETRERNEFWVIVSLMIRMNINPEWGQKITVETWPKGIDRLFAFRDFKIMDAGGAVMGAATSTWMILDQDTRRPKSVDVVKPVLHMASNHDGLEGNPPLLMPLQEIIHTETRQVRFSEVDQNGHVNNIRYIDWCLDALPSAWHRKHRIRTLVINYLSEVRGDEIMEISSGTGREQSHYIQGTRQGDGKTIFRTRVDWTS